MFAVCQVGTGRRYRFLPVKIVSSRRRQRRHLEILQTKKKAAVETGTTLANVSRSGPMAELRSQTLPTLDGGLDFARRKVRCVEGLRFGAENRRSAKIFGGRTKGLLRVEVL